MEFGNSKYIMSCSSSNIVISDYSFENSTKIIPSITKFDENILNFRLGEMNDIPRCLEIIDDAKNFMQSYGSGQWSINTPREEKLIRDVNNRALYLLEVNFSVNGIFVLYEKEPTYDLIYDGKWITDGSSFIVIHTFAIDSVFRKHGYGKAVLDYVKEKAIKNKKSSIRLDTHELNSPLINLLNREGYSYCGWIRLNVQEDNKRLAFELDLRKLYNV
jgi:GNAT superfamily N-acetyltransferase